MNGWLPFIRDAIDKATLSLQLHTLTTNQLSDAYSKGGKAILDAQVLIASSPLAEKLQELEASLAADKDKLGENSTEYKNLAKDTETARTELAAYQQQILAGKQADLALGLEQSANALRDQVTGLAITGAAIGGTTEQLRQAAVQAQLTQYALSHIGVDTTSKAWQDYAAAVDAASKATQDNRTKEQAGSYDLLQTFQKKMADLESYRDALGKNATAALSINAAEKDATLQLSKSYDQLLLKVGTTHDGVEAFFRDFANDGTTSAKQVYDALSTTFDGLQKSLTNLVVTGKGGFAELGKSIETSVVSSGMHDILQQASKGLSGVFGVDLGLGGKRDGNSANNALFVQNVDASGNVLSGGLAGGLPTNLGSIFDSGPAAPGGSGFNFSSITGLLSKAGSGIGSLFGKLGGIFGGFLAGGGDVTPGRAYVVGEQRPELFVPKSAGTIVPSISSGETKVTNLSVAFNGVTDHDSFRRSQGQIMRQLGHAVGTAQARG